MRKFGFFDVHPFFIQSHFPVFLLFFQCLKETHKLHIGAPLDDPGANGDVIAGCGRKAYLIVDAELYPDAPTLQDGE
jgi:hypothetical protein